MTREEKRHYDTEQAWADLEDREERRRVAGIDWTFNPEPSRTRRIPLPVIPRKSFVIEVVSSPGNRRTRYSIEAIDRDQAEWMAIDYHGTEPGKVTFINGMTGANAKKDGV